MKEFCPNKASKEFKELAGIFGEDKAYFLWMRNKGNHLDKAPNGADSKLFNTLLEEVKGDRTEALKAKAKVYSHDFFKWFGDWTGTYNMSMSAKRVILDQFNEKGMRQDELGILKDLIEDNNYAISYKDAEKLYDAVMEFSLTHLRTPLDKNLNDENEVLDIAFGKPSTVQYFAVDVK